MGISSGGGPMNCMKKVVVKPNPTKMRLRRDDDTYIVLIPKTNLLERARTGKDWYSLPLSTGCRNSPLPNGGRKILENVFFLTQNDSRSVTTLRIHKVQFLEPTKNGKSWNSSDLQDSLEMTQNDSRSVTTLPNSSFLSFPKTVKTESFTVHKRFGAVTVGILTPWPPDFERTSA